MLKAHHLFLLVSLLADGGTVAPPSSNAKPDAGLVSPQPGSPVPDAGIAALPAGTTPSIPWPKEELRPLATLDGPAILAAHAALQEALKRFPKESAGKCAFSPRSLETVIGYEAGWYFVRVNRRVDRCPGFGPGVALEFDWFELYAISPEGRIERYPYHP
jgi:hypothetical protein